MNQKPVYKTEEGKPVHRVRNASIKKVEDTVCMYEIQLNDQYFEISEDMLEVISSIISLGNANDVGISIG